VHKQQRVGQVERKLHEALVADQLALVGHVAAVKEPEGDEEDDGEEGDERPEDPDSGQRGPRTPEEDGPGADDEHHELESERDEHAVALYTADELVLAQVEDPHVRQSHHDDRADEGENGEEARNKGADMTADAKGHAAVRRVRVCEAELVVAVGKVAVYATAPTPASTSSSAASETASPATTATRGSVEGKVEIGVGRVGRAILAPVVVLKEKRERERERLFSARKRRRRE
jgi:hypothetical protein